MTVSKDILAKLMAEPITKSIDEPGQGDITILESELVAKAAKIKTTDDNTAPLLNQKQTKFIQEVTRMF